MTAVDTRSELLTDDMLARFDQRAPLYDHDNEFFTADFEELRASGYLSAPLPTEYGGSGLTLSQVNKLQRRLAYYAPATAIAVNMHLYWVGMAADLNRMGDTSLRWILEKAAAGEVFAAGHAEVGNDIPVLLATTKADRVDGGYEITGHKIFGSLSPVWTYLGFHAMDTSDPTNPTVVHGFLHRDTPRYRIEETWDTLGMRATMSHDTIFDKTFVPDDAILLTCAPGFAGASLFHVALFAWALTGFAAPYAGIACRAFDETVAKVKQRTSIAMTRSMAYHPEVQHYVAEMRINLEALDAYLDRVCDDWTNGVDHGMEWPLKLVACRYDVAQRAWAVVDRAIDATGGSGIFKRSRLEHLCRDGRLGRVHPVNTMLTHELVGKMSLGISPDEQPRWG